MNRVELNEEQTTWTQPDFVKITLGAPASASVAAR